MAKTGLQAAKKAAQYISAQVHEMHTIQFKSGVQSLATQVVTAIDMESQRLILDHLTESMHLFDLGLLTEESPDDGSRFTKDYFWCIDPLDGTLPFTEQKPGYAVSIALTSRTGEPVIGIVVDPYHDKNYVAIKGKGCWVNGEPYKSKSGFKNSLICNFDRSFSQSDLYEATITALKSLSIKLGYHGLEIYNGPGAVMNALNLLDSQGGCYFKFPKRNPGGGCIWDYAATSLIYIELGLHVSDIYGTPLNLNRSDTSFMNQDGILFSTDSELGSELVTLYKSLLR